MMRLTVRELAAHIGGIAERGAKRIIAGVRALPDAGPDDVTFVVSAHHGASLNSSAAGAVLLPAGLDAPERMAVIRVSDPLLAMARAIDVVAPMPRRQPGISPNAIVADTAVVHPEASLGPGCIIGERTTIGARTDVRAGATVGDDCVIGDDCVLYSGVHVCDAVAIGHRVILHPGVVLGGDGFGYVREALPPGASRDEPFRHRKIRHVGTVVIEDDVEIGANTTIDRAMLSETRVGRGTKIDNLVMVGHNCVIGRHCVIVGQVGLSGSAELGDYVTIAGQAGIIHHAKIGEHAVIGSQAGVIRDVPPRSAVLGMPAVDVKQARKALPLIAHLPELRRLARSLERRIAALETSSPPADRR